MTKERKPYVSLNLKSCRVEAIDEAISTASYMLKKPLKRMELINYMIDNLTAQAIHDLVKSKQT